MKAKRRLLDKRLKNRALRKGVNFIKKKAQSRVRVFSGEIRDSLEVETRGDFTVLTSDDPGALTTEFRDQPYIRPSIRSEKRKFLTAVGNEYKKEI